MHRVTLTFDNGPTPDVTPFVLDELRARDIAAYFCVVGMQLEVPGGDQIVLRALHEGHRVVNHSYTHKKPLGDDPTEEYALREIVDMHDLMVRKLGWWGDAWFRPFGRGGKLGRHLFSRPALEKLCQLRYSVLLWNCIPRDWIDTDSWAETALNQIAQTDHAVVVLHDIPTGAMRYLPYFLDALSERGAEFTTDVPDSCVPVKKGVPITDLDPFSRSGPRSRNWK